ncbi:suppressor APC domain-containing protein 2-like isoform X2 [Coregonus clupeaformis]|uniref:suppressor APC domain-containing protein 2-like isoform X2 n=1 Tax=Coregonus clupeaformis TaxID=59861 RepID=UPI001BDFC2A7|nr:suppressor APC domain-containing protein 2-like isoform X2 [Coregonus clupeaformis]
MALIATDTDRSCKLNGSSTIYGRIGTRQGKASRTGKMQPKDTEYSTDGLPKAFLHSLRTIFDILDDGKRGYVHISEIESRWQGADTHDLPGGVMECLRRVAPRHGCLTFERFVAGLRHSMLNPDNNSHIKAQASLHPKQALMHSKQHHLPAQKPAPLSPCSVGTRIENKVRPLGPSNGTNTHHNRASSLQSRSRHEEGNTAYPPVTSVVGGPMRYTNACYERTGRSLERITIVPESGSYRADSVWLGKQAHRQQSRVRSIESLALESPSLQKPSIVEAGLPRSQSESATGFTASRRHGRSRDEQRRHTITNGVDYGMLKQMKELEQEKDSLLAGLDVLERSREWYQTQIHNVTERQRHVGQSNHCTDFFTESQNQSRMNVLLPKLQEVNRCLNDLISCSGTSFPSSGTQPTVISSSSQPPAPPQAIQRLKDQNRLLTQEVTDKGKRITQLEQEKSALIKQLFEARARNIHDSSTMDSTFI